MKLPEYGSFGLYLRMNRLACGMTQTAVAAVLQISKPSVWAWEADISLPSAIHVMRLSSLLGLDHAEFCQRYVHARAQREIQP